jgi:hypothetical protein
MSQLNEQYSLTYYNLRGLAEPNRFMFAYAGVSYEDKRIPLEGNHPRLAQEIKDGKTNNKSTN